MTASSTTSLTRPRITSPTDCFIGGEWVPSVSDARFDVVDPATGEVIATVADGGIADAEKALAAAVDSAAEWAATAPRVRSDILRTAYEMIMARSEELAAIITAEMGKPLADARGEVAYGAEFFR